MNLPFLRFFKKDSAPATEVEAAPRRIVAIEKPASERLGKTVMPNSSRVIGSEPVRNFSVPPSSSAGHAIAPPPVPVTAPTPVAPRKISLGANVGEAAIRIADAGERTIALQLADLIPHIPEGKLAPVQIDPHHRVLFNASEMERGMAIGRPTVPLRAIYQQVPEFFTAEIDQADKTEVTLPFGKVLEQFASLQVRPDQVSEETVPVVDTPFLKAAIEDGERLGVSVEPEPKARFEAPSATTETASVIPKKISPPMPSPALEPKPVKPIGLSIPSAETSGNAPTAPAPIRLEVPTTRPPLVPKISPNGTGAPASERVPASSGPSVPTPLPSPFAPPPAARVSFKVTPPSNDLRELFAPKAPAAISPASTSTSSPANDGPRVRLPLRNVLRGIPPFQISGPVEEVPESVEIEFPFSIVEPQLSLGKISVSPAQFTAALPEEFRSRFQLEDREMPVALPLQDVLARLPNESIQLRGDQEEAEVAHNFETPFSQKAAEDAARFQPPAAPIARKAEPIASNLAESAPAPIKIAFPTGPEAKPIAKAEEKSDPKLIVARASTLPGVSSCAVVFSDGLSLAGNIAAEHGLEPLCAMAPSIMKRIGDQLAASDLGSVNSVTLSCANTSISFFAEGNICLAALHTAGELTSETRLGLHATTQELARNYTQPAAA
ncbi:MAG TPA: hypothetical protein VGF73_12760 [Chthoniobacterales bacterium]